MSGTPMETGRIQRYNGINSVYMHPFTLGYKEASSMREGRVLLRVACEENMTSIPEPLDPLRWLASCCGVRDSISVTDEDERRASRCFEGLRTKFNRLRTLEITILMHNRVEDERQRARERETRVLRAILTACGFWFLVLRNSARWAATGYAGVCILRLVASLDGI